MEFLKVSKRRTFFSEVLYVILNLILVAALVAIVIVFDSPWPGFALVLLSKWRVLAVRPHYWMEHIVANMVDIIVGLSAATFVFTTGVLPAQIAVGVLYVIWLLFVKPQSKKPLIKAQAAIALLIGLMALSQLSHDWWSSAAVLVAWIIGYSTARHVLIGVYKDPHSALLSSIWGLIIAELAWLSYHWTIAYSLHFSTSFLVSQFAIIATLLSFLAERTYASYRDNGKIGPTDIILPLLLTIGVTVVLLVFFNGSQTGNL